MYGTELFTSRTPYPRPLGFINIAVLLNQSEENPELTVYYIENSILIKYHPVSLQNIIQILAKLCDVILALKRVIANIYKTAVILSSRHVIHCTCPWITIRPKVEFLRNCPVELVVSKR